VSFLLSTKQVLDWPSHLNTYSYTVKDLKVKDGMLYVCAGNIFRGSLSADTSFEKLSSFLGLGDSRTIAIKDSILYIGGHFIYNAVLKGLIALNINTKATLPLLLPSPQ
jgi:hypothetical protein